MSFEDGEILLTEPQTEFLQCDDKFPLFVAGFGAGKSSCMGVSILSDLNYECDQPIKLGAYAPTYDLLKLITIPYLCELLEYSGYKFKLNRSDFIITIETGDQIILRSLDNPARIVGYQTFRAHIDEIDTLPQAKADDAWNKVIARNRQPVPILDESGNYIFIEHESGNYIYLEDEKIFEICDPGDGDFKRKLEQNRVSGYTTPEGFSFAYNRWVEKVAEFKEKGQENPGYRMIQASTYSNPHLPDDYIPALRATYPAGLVDAYIEGKFVNLIGKTVYTGFCRVKNHTDEEVSDEFETLYVGMDFNVVHGASAIHVLRNGLPHAVDEIHDAYDTDEQIAILRERYPQNPIEVYPDATGDRRTSANTTESDIAKLQSPIARMTVFRDNINPPIKDRVMSYNAMLCNGEGVRKYFVNTKKCPNLTKSLEQQIWDKNGLPDKTSGLDHIVDGGGYYIFFKFGITKTASGVFTTRGGY